MTSPRGPDRVGDFRIFQGNEFCQSPRFIPDEISAPIGRTEKGRSSKNGQKCDFCETDLRREGGVLPRRQGHFAQACRASAFPRREPPALRNREIENVFRISGMSAGTCYPDCDQSGRFDQNCEIIFPSRTHGVCGVSSVETSFHRSYDGQNAHWKVFRHAISPNSDVGRPAAHCVRSVGAPVGVHSPIAGCRACKEPQN